MGFNKLYLPDLSQLQQQLKEEGRSAFVDYWERRHNKADAIIGSCDSSNFIKQLLNSEYNHRETGQLEFDFNV